MHKKILLMAALASAFPFLAFAQDVPSGLDKKNFGKYWKVESESPDYKLTFHGDTLEMLAPKGLTLWRKEKMTGNVSVEYDACVMNERPGDRLSDLNCFWMASDPLAPDIWKNGKERGGKFVNCYALQLYYLGYGGNHNSTTRFRRYDGNRDGITNAEARPKILREYTDAENLLKPNKWYHIKITADDGRTEYFIDGKRLVDFRDPNPLTEGWFGFRTTESRVKIANFKWSQQKEDSSNIPVRWVNGTPGTDRPVTMGIPFRQGEMKKGQTVQLSTPDGKVIPTDAWNLATWPDGSVKWMAVAGVMPKGAADIKVAKVAAPAKGKKNAAPPTVIVSEDDGAFVIDTGKVKAFIPKAGENFIDSLLYDGVKVAANGRLVASTQSEPVLESTKSISFNYFKSKVSAVEIERAGNNRALVKVTGSHAGDGGREWLPFVVRLYFYGNSPEIKMVHSFIFDGDQNKDFIRGLGVRFDVPMREALYNRHVAFSGADGGVWSEPVEPLVGRRVLNLDPDKRGVGEPLLQQMQMRGERVPELDAFNDYNQKLIRDWASWNSYRLSQLTADSYEIRKRANDNNPWIGTFSGTRSSGYAFAGDISGGLGINVKDFWESFPSSIEISNATAPVALLTAWLWSPDAAPMDLRHYDNRAHDLISSYEDVQEGMSTPYGVARTSELTIFPQGGYSGKADFAKDALSLQRNNVLLPTPEYLHSRRAFGVWSLPDDSNPRRAEVEAKLKAYLDFYKDAIEQNKWFGFWNYGDVMHAYDPVRHDWKYDVGGYAWDNTELASPMWLWYNFLRSGDPDVWKMAVAMFRHNSEVDVYHIGDNKGLGSRHNVSHWGCGAKEGRISQAAWNRFYYYLTGDERAGDLLTEVKDADQLLYTLDPMRLAEPRDLYPCSAPARLRIGPDWLSYAGNWMTEWERTGNVDYRDKIIAGMKSIAALPGGMFTGPLALGYDPATGVITTECDPALRTTNHLMTIMGGFEIMNELQQMVNVPEFNEVWLDHAARYKEMARTISKNRFRVSRLAGFAAHVNNDLRMANDAWSDLLTRLEHTEAPKTTVTTVFPPEVPAPKTEMLPISTNDAAMWSLDAIYLQEVIPLEEDDLSK